MLLPPKAEQLPEALRELAYRQAFSVRPPGDFDHDVEKLIQKINGEQASRKKSPIAVSKPKRPSEVAPTWRRLVLAGVAIVVAGAILAMIFFQSPNRSGSDDSSTSTKPPDASRASSSGQTAPAAANADGNFEGSRAGETREDNGLALPFVWITPGTFIMGSAANETGRSDDENQLQVTLTTGFWLGLHEVTQTEWRRVMRTEPWSGKPHVEARENYPATYITWEEATKFCETLTKREQIAGRLPSNWQFALPTEAQWEYACRAGTNTRFSFGDDDSLLGDYALYVKNASDAGKQEAHLTGQKKPNPWGLLDIHGNVWEWCRDWYGPTSQEARTPWGRKAAQAACSRAAAGSSPQSAVGRRTEADSRPASAAAIWASAWRR
jgi:formylglycine-generating enzyme required for sulfatase activity